RPIAAAYRDVLLNPNEPFIRAQMDALARYRQQFLCMRRVDGIDLPASRTWALHDGSMTGRAAELLFKRTGLSPRLERQLRRLRPALIHAYTGVDGAVMLPLARRLGIPLVVSFTGFDATASDQQLRRSSPSCHAFLRRRDALRRGAALTIAVSVFLKRCLVERGYSDARVVAHHIGVDTARFRPDGAVPREAIVLFVGRLLEVKGVSHLLAA